MANQDNYEIFEKYVKGQLSEAESQSLEERLQSTPELDQEFKAYRMGGIAIDIYHRDQLKQELLQKTRQRQREVDHNRNVLMRAAAAVGLVLVVALSWMFSGSLFNPSPSGGMDPVALYEQNFERPDFNAFLGSPEDEEWSLLEAEFKNGNCQTVLEKLNDGLIIEENNKQDQAALMKGTCLLQEKDTPDEAITSLQLITATSIHYPAAQWYIGLTHLKNRDLEKAKTQFSKILADVSLPKNIRNKAQTIMKEIEK